MSCCCASYRLATERQFDLAVAARDLARYRRKGPDASSRLLLTGLEGQLKNADAVLDIGAGVGTVSFELLSKGAASTTLVDASPAYLDAAWREAQERQLTDRVRRVAGDFTSVSEAVEPADVVTMHRVVCCYPDYESLLQAAMTRAGRVLAFSYPRDRWFVRFWLSIENTLRRVKGSGFRTFVHSPVAMNRMVITNGFQLAHRAQTQVWSMDVYLRTPTAAGQRVT